MTPQPDLLQSRDTIYNAMSSILTPVGGSVTRQGFNSGGYAGKNIVGVLPGHGPDANHEIVIDAHYDSVQNPGADDDASGVAAVLEAANVLAHYNFDKTIVFIAFDQEEQRTNGWGQGSTYYATNAAANGELIDADISMDMIAYNDHGSNVAYVGPCAGGAQASADLAKLFFNCYAQYTTLNPKFVPNIHGTDAFQFFTNGYMSASATGNSPYYHSSDDYYLNTAGQPQTYKGLPYINFAYATEETRGGVSLVALEAGLIGNTVRATSVTPGTVHQTAIHGHATPHLTDSIRHPKPPRTTH
jgi:Zn-dependent M28 family amino/carboxypeptidase